MPRVMIGTLSHPRPTWQRLFRLVVGVVGVVGVLLVVGVRRLPRDPLRLAAQHAKLVALWVSQHTELVVLECCRGCIGAGQAC